jgi:hypothetical protein
VLKYRSVAMVCRRSRWLLSFSMSTRRLSSFVLFSLYFKQLHLINSRNKRATGVLFGEFLLLFVALLLFTSFFLLFRFAFDCFFSQKDDWIRYSRRQALLTYQAIDRRLYVVRASQQSYLAVVAID